jgi:hypothetical protein
MQVFRLTEHQISDHKRTGNRRHQPSRYDDFYSPIHLTRSFGPPLLVGSQRVFAPQPICYASGNRRECAECTMNLNEVVTKII